MSTPAFFKTFAKFLMARPLTGGLEINDTSLRFVSAEGAALRTASVRLAPEVLRGGRIESRPEFVEALKALRAQILGGKSRRRAPINVVVSLSSVNIYTQVFNLPFIEGENLEKAIQLNVQMASPSGAAADTYAGWQTVRAQDEHNMHLEVVTAFLPRGTADDMTTALRAGGFLPIALESRALSLARLIKNKAAGVDPNASIIAVSADASGLDVMIVRAGHMHFDYFNSWQDLQGAERQISIEMFRSLVVRGVNQVLNFYNAHWKDPVTEIVVAATGLKDEILGAVRENFEMKVSELTPLVSPPLTPEWFVALGGALRGLVPRRQDAEISLLGVSARDEFQREQAHSFLDFWRVLVPAALGVLLVVFAAGYFFLNTFEQTLASAARVAQQQPPSAELRDLRLKAEQFNADVAMIRGAQGAVQRKSRIFATLLEVFNRRNIGVDRLTVADPATPVALSGHAATEEDIVALKNELVVTQGFRSIDLPLTGIRPRSADFSFTMTFTADP